VVNLLLTWNQVEILVRTLPCTTLQTCLGIFLSPILVREDPFRYAVFAGKSVGIQQVSFLDKGCTSMPHILQAYFACAALSGGIAREAAAAVNKKMVVHSVVFCMLRMAMGAGARHRAFWCETFLSSPLQVWMALLARHFKG